MDSASSSGSSSPGFRSTVFKHPLLTPQQRYKQLQLQREQAAVTSTAKQIQRDRMARGKDPYGSDDASDMDEHLAAADSSPAKFRLGGTPEEDDFGKKERRDKAIAFLGSPELLMMYAQSTNDSVAGARLHFMKMMCGYDEQSVAERDYYNKTNPASRQSHQHYGQRDAGDRSGRGGGGERASGGR